MISSGMSILRSLYVLEEQTDNKFLTETIVAGAQGRRGGLSLSDSMARHPKVFNTLFVAMTRAGEAGGVLEDALMRVADQLQKDASLRKQIKSAMVYPTLVIIFAVGVMMALVAFLVPVFVGVFKQFGGELPALTKVSVFLSVVVDRLLVGDLRRNRPRVLFFREVEEKLMGAQAVGPFPSARPHEDRSYRPAGRGGALVAHAGLADERWSAPPAGA